MFVPVFQTNVWSIVPKILYFDFYDQTYCCLKFIGLIRQPKYGHLKELHKAIKQCEPALVSADPTVTSIGNLQQVVFFIKKLKWNQINKQITNTAFSYQAHVFSSESGHCAAFLANYNTNNAAKVMFNNMHYTLPPWSISILPDCTNVVFNTAKVWRAPLFSRFVSISLQLVCFLGFWSI